MNVDKTRATVTGEPDKAKSRAWAKGFVLTKTFYTATNVKRVRVITSHGRIIIMNCASGTVGFIPKCRVVMGQPWRSERLARLKYMSAHLGECLRL